MEKGIMEKFEKYRTELVVFLTIFILGYMVHGSMIFNTYLAGDDLLMNNPGGTTTSGRWFLEVIFRISRALFGSYINAKGFIAIVSFILLAVIGILIAKSMDFKGYLELILLSAVLVVFPYVTTLFGYSFTAVPYYLAIIMVLCSARLLVREKFDHLRFRSIFVWCLSVGLVIFATAVYQTMLSVFIMFLVVLEIKKVQTCSISFKQFIKEGILYVLALITALLAYGILNKIILRITGLQLTGYQGINAAFSITVSGMLTRVKWCYREFFFPARKATYSFYYPGMMRLCYSLIILVLVIAAGVSIWKAWKKNRLDKACELAVLYILCPLAVNSFFLLVEVEANYVMVYSLMMFAQFGTYLLLLLVIKNRFYFKDILSRCSTGLLILMIVFFAYRANVSYTKMAIMHSEAKSYMTTLVTRIQQLPFYNEETPIAFLEWEHKADTDIIKDRFEGTNVDMPYFPDTLINTYNWDEFIRMWCGFDWVEVSEEETDSLEQTPEVLSMPCYPNAGSIDMVDGTIVVKFGEMEKE